MHQQRAATRTGVPGAGTPPPLKWIGEKILEVDAQQYFVTADIDATSQYEAMGVESTDDRLVLVKHRRMLETICERHGPGGARNVVELGIFKGGSTAFLQQILRPGRLVAIDIDPSPVAVLEHFIERHGLADVIRPRYGVDQGDRAALAAVLTSEFGNERLDLVIDDASHLLPQTRASFEVLFPRLRPGGAYMIEDWGWAHNTDDLWQRGGGHWRQRPALTNLIVELLMIAASRSDVIPSLLIDGDVAEVTRGPADLGASVALSELYVNRGNPFRPLI